MTAVARANPSGRLVQPKPSKGPFAWDMLAPLVLELLPIGHDPGVYEIVQTFTVRTLGGAATLGTSIGWNQPRFGATSLAINFGALTLSTVVNALRVVDSSGGAPLTLTLTPSGVVGAVSIEVACLAVCESLPFL